MEISKEILENFRLQESYESTLLDKHDVSLEDVNFILGNTDTEPRSYQRLTEDAKDSVAGLGKAIDFMYKLAKADEVLTSEHIKEMHGFVRNYFPYHPSDYRSVGIKMPETGEPAIAFDQIEDALEAAISKYNSAIKSDDPLLAIASFHYDFEYIHPFFEDNGKVGRLLINMGLIESGYAPITIKDYDKEAYHSAFVSEDPRSALAELLKQYIK